MSDVSKNRVGPDGVATTPTTYHVGSINLTAADGKTYEISNIVAYFEIYESIALPTIEVTLGIGDSINFMETAKLQGSEKITIDVHRKQSNGRKKFKLELYVVEIYNYVRPKPGMQTFSLRAVGEHVYVDSLTKLNRSFQGSPTDVIKKIASSDLGISNFENTAGSSNIIKGIFPNIRPLDAVDWLKEQAFDESTPFFFYHTAVDDKVHLKSYKELVGEPVYDTYVYRPFTDEDISLETKEGYEHERTKIRSLSSNYGQGKLTPAMGGAYAANLHTLDISDKSYIKTTYQYDNSMYKLNKNKSFSDSISFADRKLTEHKDAKIYFISGNKKSFNTTGNYYSTSNVDLAKAISYSNHLSHQEHTITIAGDFDLKAGDKIKVEVRKTKEEADGSGIDKLQSGIYMITAITHTFKDGYFQDLLIQKDSSEVAL